MKQKDLEVEASRRLAEKRQRRDNYKKKIREKTKSY